MDDETAMSAAEEALADRLAGDMGRILQAGVLIEDLRIEGDGPVRVVVACLVDGVAMDLEGSGGTAMEAAGEVIRQATERRGSSPLWGLTGPG